VPKKASLSEVSEWCWRSLSSPVEQVLFEAGFLSQVFGVRLQDGREVVTKVRTYTPRLAGAAAVQRRLWEMGFPCPRPLAGPAELAGYCISAETLVAGGSPSNLGSASGGASRLGTRRAHPIRASC